MDAAFKHNKAVLQNLVGLMVDGGLPHRFDGDERSADRVISEAVALAKQLYPLDDTVQTMSQKMEG
eukprot:1454864-Pyramimonas_sp.AAC.1